ncbi:hypothetical protein [Synechococcus elongatus]|nr:hypothetical protein [Synechococcus elongatus]
MNEYCPRNLQPTQSPTAQSPRLKPTYPELSQRFIGQGRTANPNSLSA